MKILNTLFNVMAVAYAFTLALLLTGLVPENEIFNQVISEAQALALYKNFAGAGAGLILIKVILSSLYSANLRYQNHIAELKINDLKTELFEKRQELRSNNFRTPVTEERLSEAV